MTCNVHFWGRLTFWIMRITPYGHNHIISKQVYQPNEKSRIVNNSLAVNSEFEGLLWKEENQAISPPLGIAISP